MGRPDTTERDRLYEVLRRRGERGVEHRELPAFGVHDALKHVESLRLEGHKIAVLEGVDSESGRTLRLIILRRDAWATAA